MMLNRKEAQLLRRALAILAFQSPESPPDPEMEDIRMLYARLGVLMLNLPKEDCRKP
jgi:hypothetical protein